MLVRSFAAAYGPDGVRVNCIAPGFMADPMKGEGAELRARRGGRQTVIDGAPLRRLIVPQDIANAAAFLCSNEASAITGIVLPVDAANHPLLGTTKKGRMLTYANYMNARHVDVSPRGATANPIDAALGEDGKGRHVALTVPHTTVLSALLPGKDLITRVPEPCIDTLCADGALARWRM